MHVSNERMSAGQYIVPNISICVVMAAKYYLKLEHTVLTDVTVTS